MKTSDFDYDLPESLIAQTPVEPRDSSRLLVMDRKTGTLEQKYFHQIDEYLRAGDLLVLNRTRVIPARLFARKETGGRVELLLLRRHDPLIWEALVGGKGLRVGTTLTVEDGPKVKIEEMLDGSGRLIKFAEAIEPFFEKVGQVPLPPYIHEKLADPERYQTIYAREPGSAAAPTAGLHFTTDLLERLEAQGVRTTEVTLHVGLDTFAPVNEEDPHEHKIHSEWCELPAGSADMINETKNAGGRIVAVGTTSVRTLESALIKNPQGAHVLPAKSKIVNPITGPTSLFILPGYKFQVVDAMITNFHLPKSTLLMLVSAFAGHDRIMNAYKTAIHEGFRFYSFGDAMLIF